MIFSLALFVLVTHATDLRNKEYQVVILLKH
jgi:hypothetical protein